MIRFDVPPVANVTEAGDIVLLAFVVVLTLASGLALLGIDAVVARRGRGADPDTPES